MALAIFIQRCERLNLYFLVIVVKYLNKLLVQERCFIIFVELIERFKFGALVVIVIQVIDIDGKEDFGTLPVGLRRKLVFFHLLQLILDNVIPT